MSGTVLVTGGAGFIGSHLCASLQAQGFDVHSASRRPAAGDSRVRHWQVDLADTTATLACLRAIRPSHVFHLASHVKGAPDIEHVIPTFRDNLQSTVNLLTASVECGCPRFVLTSSLMERPDRSGDPTPTSPYGASKWASAAYCRMFRALYDLPSATARLSVVYGPGQQDNTKLVPYTIQSIQQGKSPEISSGRRMVDWIYVTDVVEGLLQLGSSPDFDGLTVDLGTGSLVSTADLVTMICRIMDPAIQPRIGVLPERRLEPSDAADVATTRRLIGWTAGTPLEQGLRRTIESYRRA